MTALKTVIVGFGAIARGFAADPLMAKYFPIATHAQAIKGSKGFELIGVVDPSAEARAVAEKEWRVPAAADLAAAATAFDPDILVLATKPGTRTDALRAFPNVRGVMAEKPLGGEDGETLVKLAAERNIPLQVHFWRRGDPTHRELAAGGLEKHVGAVQAVLGLYGNGLNNNGSHLIDAARFLFGEPVSAQAISELRPCTEGPIPGDVQLPFALTFAGGFTMTAQPLDFRHYREVALDIWGTTGRLAVTQESLVVRAYPPAANRGLTGEMEINSDTGTIIPCRVGEALPALYANLAAAVAGKEDLLSSGEGALRTERVLAAILASAAGGGQPVTI